MGNTVQNATLEGRLEKKFPSWLVITVKSFFRGIGQVMFQCNAWTGVLFLIGIIWGAYAEGNGLVAWGAITGCAASTFAGYITRNRGCTVGDGEQGLWGFNGTLVGCAFPTFLGNTWMMWMGLLICAMMTTWIRRGFNNVMAPWHINSLTFPFVFMTWFFLLCAREMKGLPSTGMDAPSLDFAIHSHEDYTFGILVKAWLKNISQVFLINSWVTGIFFIVALAVSNRFACLWACVASALALATAIVFQAGGVSIDSGLYGFSAVLTGIALGATFYKPSWVGAIWTLFGIIVTVFIQAGMNAFFAPWGMATLTGPFCVATWLMLLPRIKLDDRFNPDMSDWQHDLKSRKQIYK